MEDHDTISSTFLTAVLISGLFTASVYSSRTCSTIEATGTPPRTVIELIDLFPFVPSPFTGATEGNRHYRGTTAVVVTWKET